MKPALLILFFGFLACSSAFADGCVDNNGKDLSNQPGAFIPLISQKSDCYSAKAMAESCAWGSSMDIQTAGAAYQVCAAQLAKEKPGASDLVLLKTMEDRCNTKWANMQGTLYESENAFCHLSAVAWIQDIDSPADQN